MCENIAIRHGKGEFSKIKQNICNFPIEIANICNILPRPTISNGLIVVKLKRGIKYRDHLCIEPVPHTSYTRRLLIKNYIINSMKIFLLTKVCQVRTCSGFLILLKFKDKMRLLLKKLFLIEKRLVKIEMN